MTGVRDRLSNLGSLALDSDALPTALRGLVCIDQNHFYSSVKMYIVYLELHHIHVYLLIKQTFLAILSPYHFEQCD